MNRDCVRVAINEKQLKALEKLDQQDEDLKRFIKDAQEQLGESREDAQQWITAATTKYAEEGDRRQIDFDSDAAISEADTGAWVMGWLWVRTKEFERAGHE